MTVDPAKSFRCMTRRFYALLARRGPSMARDIGDLSAIYREAPEYKPSHGLI